MSVMSMCLAAVHNEIPQEIIDEAFVIPFRTNYFTPVSADAMIMEKVVQARVLPELNITYAVTYKVPIHMCKVTQTGIAEYVVEVPPKTTANRKIVTVLGISAAAMGTVPYGHNQTIHYGSGSAILDAGTKLANATGGAALDYNARVQMISPNAFRVQYQGYLNPSYSVELVLEHDSTLSNIPITSVLHFQELVLEATKAYIYNKLKIKIDRAKLDGGSELGAFQEIVDSYADANEKYKELRERSTKISWFNDREGLWDFMRNIIGNNF